MNLTDALSNLVDTLNGLLNAMTEMMKSLSRAAGSLLDDSPIGWSYYEKDRFATSVDGRWVDRKTEQYGEWMVCHK